MIKGYRNFITLHFSHVCKVRIANKKLLSDSTPEVFFSGALHGDERHVIRHAGNVSVVCRPWRIGPATVNELAAFLCEQYAASHPEDGRGFQ